MLKNVVDYRIFNFKRKERRKSLNFRKSGFFSITWLKITSWWRNFIWGDYTWIQNTIFSNFGIFNFKRGRGDEGRIITKFQKIWIFEHNLAPNYFIVKKLYYIIIIIWGDYNWIQKTILSNFGIFDFKGRKEGKINTFWKIWIFELIFLIILITGSFHLNSGRHW